MKHPFRVGERYRNRNGEYEVIRLEEPTMAIRYLDGQTLETTVELQARIWRNMGLEESIKARAPALTPRRPHQGRRQGLEFRGLQDHDFQRGVAGTSWRARQSLGGLLAQRMTDTTPHTFHSYAIYRRAEVHIAQPTRYHQATRWREAKFVFYLEPESAVYGFYVEKNNGPMDDTWNWRSLLGALEGTEELQKEVKAVMLGLGLHWEVHIPEEGGLIGETEATHAGMTWRRKDSRPENTSWPHFIKILRDIDNAKWCDLYLCTYLPKDRAIAAGVQLVDPVTEVYRALLPLYEASTR